MSKEKILKKFRKKTALKDDVKSITIEEYNEIMLYTETLLEKALDQTREETIRKVEENYPTPHFLNGLAKASYSEIEFMAFKNGVFQTYQRLKQSLKSLINK